jgi:hypothetical protein
MSWITGANVMNLFTAVNYKGARYINFSLAPQFLFVIAVLDKRDGGIVPESWFYQSNREKTCKIQTL